MASALKVQRKTRNGFTNLAKFATGSFCYTSVIMLCFVEDKEWVA